MESFVRDIATTEDDHDNIEENFTMEETETHDGSISR